MPKTQLPFQLSVIEFQSFIDGWLFDCEIRQCSPRTLEKRRGLLKCFRWWLNHARIETLTTHTFRLFLHYVENGHKDPDGRWGNPREREPVKPGTVASFHSTLRALCNWIAAETDEERSLMHRVSAPIDRPDQIQPFTEEQVEQIVQAAKRSSHRRRDEAIVFFLLDTGVRVSELCSLHLSDVSMAAKSAKVEGKGGKSRTVYFGSKTARALWTYLREEEREENAPLFISDRGLTTGEAMTRNGVLLLLRRLGKAAGVEGVRVSPHTFRHTFAISFLRNGGNQFTLMTLLGHTDVKQTKRYVDIAQADAAMQHRLNSPVDRMRKKK